MDGVSIFGQHISIYGTDVVVSHDRPKYQLPEEIMPGVPYGAEFRKEINEWAREFLGKDNLIKDGEAVKMGNVIFVNPRTFESIKRALVNDYAA